MERKPFVLEVGALILGPHVNAASLICWTQIGANHSREQ
jgi:hypothetical protein